MIILHIRRVYTIILLQILLLHQITATKLLLSQNSKENGERESVLENELIQVQSTTTFPLNTREPMITEIENERTPDCGILKPIKEMGTSLKNFYEEKQMNFRLAKMKRRLSKEKLCFPQPLTLKKCGNIKYFDSISDCKFELYNEKSIKLVNPANIVCIQVKVEIPVANEEDPTEEPKPTVIILCFANPSTMKQEMDLKEYVDHATRFPFDEYEIISNSEKQCCFPRPYTIGFGINVKIEYKHIYTGNQIEPKNEGKKLFHIRRPNCLKKSNVEENEFFDAPVAIPKHRDYVGSKPYLEQATKLRESYLINHEIGRKSLNSFALEYLIGMQSKSNQGIIDKVMKTAHAVMTSESGEEGVRHCYEEIGFFLVREWGSVFWNDLFGGLKKFFLKKNIHVLNARIAAVINVMIKHFNKESMQHEINLLMVCIKDPSFTPHLRKAISFMETYALKGNQFFGWFPTRIKIFTVGIIDSYIGFNAKSELKRIKKKKQNLEKRRSNSSQ